MTQSSDEYRFRPLRFTLSKSSTSEGVDGRAMSQFTIVAPVRRMSFYYVFNHYLPASIIQTLSFGMFAVRLNHESIYERMMLLITTFVVLAAFKMQMAGEVPRVPQMTHLDKYMIVGFFFMFVMYIYACVSCYMGEDMDEEVDRIALYVAISAWLLQQIVFTALAQYYISLWPKQIKDMGSLDPQTTELLIKDGFAFKDGVFGDLEVTRSVIKRGEVCLLQAYIEQLESREGGNSEEWPVQINDLDPDFPLRKASKDSSRLSIQGIQSS